MSWCRQPDGTGVFGACEASLGAMNPVVSTSGSLQIDELYVDEPGADGPNVFTELWGPPGMSLTGWRLEGVNGADGDVYRTVQLSGVMPADGRLVIATAQATGITLSARDLVGEVDWQNGPDAVRLVDGSGRVVDAVQYGTRDGFRAGEGTAVNEAPSGKSLSRKDHQDTDNNTHDFVATEPTPGA